MHTTTPKQAQSSIAPALREVGAGPAPGPAANRTLEELYRKYARFHEKFDDQELDEYLMSLARHLEDADTLYHQFAYLLMHVRATVAHPVRPKHLQEAIHRAERFLARAEEKG